MLRLQVASLLQGESLFILLFFFLEKIELLDFENNVAHFVFVYSYGGKSMPDLLVLLMSRDKPSEMQLAAARCVTYLHRAGALTAEDPKILYRTLPCLVRFFFLLGNKSVKGSCTNYVTMNRPYFAPFCNDYSSTFCRFGTQVLNLLPRALRSMCTTLNYVFLFIFISCLSYIL